MTTVHHYSAMDPDHYRGSYTYMSDEAMEATIAAIPNTPYEIAFSQPDLARLLWVLRVLYNADTPTAESEVIGEGSDLFSDHEGDIADWAGDFASSIAQTLGVEWV